MFGSGSDFFLKVFFTQKYIKIIFFYFLKIIFNISTSKRFKNKKILILNNFFLNFPNPNLECNVKQGPQL